MPAQSAQATHDNAISGAANTYNNTVAGDLGTFQSTDAGLQLTYDTQLAGAATIRDASIANAGTSVDMHLGDSDPVYLATLQAADDTYFSAAASLQATRDQKDAQADVQLGIDQQNASTQLSTDLDMAQSSYDGWAQAINANAQDLSNQAWLGYSQDVADHQTTYDIAAQAAADTYDSKAHDADVLLQDDTNNANDQYETDAGYALEAYNDYVIPRTTTYNSDIQTLANTAQDDIQTAYNQFQTDVAPYAQTLAEDTQDAIDAFNDKVVQYQQTQAGKDAQAAQVYQQTMSGANQTLQGAIDNYNDALSVLYMDAMMNNMPVDQSEVDALTATLNAAKHQYAITEAGAEQTQTLAVGQDAVEFVTSKEDAYIVEQDAIATANGTFELAKAPLWETYVDAMADIISQYDADAAATTAAYRNDIAPKYADFVEAISGFEKTREDAISEATATHENSVADAWKEMANADADAAEIQTNDDRASAEDRDNDLAGIEENRENQLAQAMQQLISDQADAYEKYNNALAEAFTNNDKTKVSDEADFENGLIDQELTWVNSVAPAQAAAVINAAGGDPGVGTAANAWASYNISAMIYFAQLAHGEVAAWKTEATDDLTAWQTEMDEDDAADKQLSKDLAAAWVIQVGGDAAAGTLFVQHVGVAHTTLVRDSTTAGKADIEAQASDAVAELSKVEDAWVIDAKAQTTAANTWVQTVAPKWLQETKDVETDAATNISQADVLADDAAHKAFHAMLTEAQTLVPQAENEVHDAAVAHKTFEIDTAIAQMNDANTAAANNVTDITNQPDENFAYVMPGSGGGGGMGMVNPPDKDPTSFWNLYTYYFNPANNSDVDGWDTFLKWFKWTGWAAAIVGGSGAVALGAAPAATTVLAWGNFTIYEAGVTISTVGMHPITWGTAWFSAAMAFGGLSAREAVPYFVEGFAGNPNAFNWTAATVTRGWRWGRPWTGVGDGQLDKPVTKQDFSWLDNESTPPPELPDFDLRPLSPEGQTPAPWNPTMPDFEILPPGSSSLPPLDASGSTQ